MKSFKAFLFVMLLGAGVTGGQSRAEEGRIRMVSYNIRHGEGMDKQINLQRIADVIAQKKPDLVALQEVDKNCTRSGNRDIAQELGEMLGMEHRFGKFMNFQGGDYGMAVLSRFPITETKWHHIPAGAEPRCALEIKVKVPGSALPVSFIGIHNDWVTEQVRVDQVQALLKALEKDDHPCILAGDFNAERTDASLQLLSKAPWTILDKKGAKTWPSVKPEVEIDHFVVRGLPLTSVEHAVIDEQMASDHRPIFAILEFQADKGPAAPTEPVEKP